MFREIFNINIKNYNLYTILSLLFLITGLVFWIMWGLRYGIWYDIGIYSITIVFVLSGVIGCIISLIEKTEGEEN